MVPVAPVRASSASEGLDRNRVNVSSLSSTWSSMTGTETWPVLSVDVRVRVPLRAV